MKKLLSVICILIVANLAKAQQKRFLLDGEKLFKTEESKLIESRLKSYYNKTKNYVAVVSTDTLDIPETEFIIRFVTSSNLLIPEDRYGFVLLLSRKQQYIYLRGTESVDNYFTKDDYQKILDAGKPDLVKKKTVDGVMKICNAAMMKINSLPQKRPKVN